MDESTGSRTAAAMDAARIARSVRWGADGTAVSMLSGAITAATAAAAGTPIDVDAGVMARPRRVPLGGGGGGGEEATWTAAAGVVEAAGPRAAAA